MNFDIVGLGILGHADLGGLYRLLPKELSIIGAD
jgi:hypothetical protein